MDLSASVSHHAPSLSDEELLEFLNEVDEVEGEEESPSVVRMAENVEKEKPKAFRLNAKNLYLTYPQCDMSPVDAMEFLKLFFGDELLWAVIGTELHEDGNPHLHYVFGLTRKVNYKDPYCLDCLTGQHGNYQGMRSKLDCIKYCSKDHEYEEYNINVANFLAARKKHKSVKAEEVAKGVMEGQDLVSLNKSYPGFMLMNLAKVKSYQSWFESTNQAAVLDGTDLPIVNPLGLTCGEVKVRAWLNANMIGKPTRNFGARQLFLWGKTNLGKTSLLMLLETKYRVYWCPMGEDYYDDYDDKLYDVIILDEFRAQKKLQFMNSFVQGCPMTLRIKNGQVMKRKNLPVIVCANYPLERCYHKVALYNPEVMETLIRRFEVVELKRSIFTLIDRLSAS